MAALNYAKLFEPAALTTSAVKYYTIPAANTLRNGVVRLTNVTAAPVTATVHAVPLSASATAANAILYGYAIPANGYLDVTVPPMKAGDEIWGLAGAATSITIHMLDGVLFS